MQYSTNLQSVWLNILILINFYSTCTQATDTHPKVVSARPAPSSSSTSSSSSSSSDSKHVSNPTVRTRQQSLSLLRRHAEKLKSFNNQSSTDFSTPLHTTPTPSISPPQKPSSSTPLKVQHSEESMQQQDMMINRAPPLVTSSLSSTTTSAKNDLLSSIKLLQRIEWEILSFCSSEIVYHVNNQL